MAVDLIELHELTTVKLRERAATVGVDPAGLRRHDLVFAVAQASADGEGGRLGTGVLEVHGEGFGFLRTPGSNFLPGQGDIYVSQSQIRRFKLQTGDTVIGQVRAPKEGERYTALLRVESVNGDPPGSEAPTFDTLTAIYPDERIHYGDDPVLAAIDLVAPAGLGQRGLLVAPARTGRVDVLRRAVNVLEREEDLEVTVLLIGERPEEIQDWRTHTKAEVIATPFDDLAARHVQVADIVFERARRMVERGDDVVLIVDSLNRLLRACLSELPAAGRDVGGVDVAALHRMRRYLGSARALQEGGSLTVIGVVSCDPDNRAGRVLIDDLQEVVNWELHLSRELADAGLRPAVDIQRSGNLREDRLLSVQELEERERWRASLTGDPVEDGTSLHSFLREVQQRQAATLAESAVSAK